MVKLTEEQRRTVIMIAAERIVLDIGLHGVTHSAVAKRCTVPTSKETVKRWFPTKADLWRGVIAHCDNDLVRDMAVGIGFDETD